MGSDESADFSGCQIGLLIELPAILNKLIQTIFLGFEFFLGEIFRLLGCL